MAKRTGDIFPTTVIGSPYFSKFEDVKLRVGCSWINRVEGMHTTTDDVSEDVNQSTIRVKHNLTVVFMACGTDLCEPRINIGAVVLGTHE